MGIQAPVGGWAAKKTGIGAARCRICARKALPWDPKYETWEDGKGDRWKGGEDTTIVAIPQVLRYLDVELASAGVKMQFKVEP